jgi:hypothetical protein
MKIDNIFDQAIEFNRELIAERDSQKAMLGEVAFAKEYATVSLDWPSHVGLNPLILYSATTQHVQKK